MGKQINLPWTCETGDKIKSIIRWSMLIFFPALLLYAVFHGLYSVKESFGLQLIGFFGTFIVWATRLVIWHSDDKFPSFKCKCDLDK
jgi:hypothetical protein